MNYYLLRAVFALALSLVLVIWPETAGEYLVITIGLMFLIPGLLLLIGYFVFKPKEGVTRRFPIESLGSTFLGLLLLINPGGFADILMFILGFTLMVGGIQQIASLIAARRWMQVPFGFYIVPVLIVVAGVVSLFDPTGARSTVFIIIGVTGILYALSELFNWFKFSRHRPKTVKKAEIEDAQIIEE